MDWSTTLAYLIAAVLLVLLNGFFVLAEFALVKVRTSRIEELVRSGNRMARGAQRMVAELDNYLSAIQLGITVASLALGWVGEPAFASLIHAAMGEAPPWSKATSHAISAAVAFIIITFLHIVFGELIPKSVAIRRPEKSILLVTYPMRLVYIFFYVPMRVLNGMALLMLRPFGLATQQFEVAHSEQELRLVLSTAQQGGNFPLNRLLMLENIFDLSTQTVRDIMVPWLDAKWLARNATRDQVVALVREYKFSRYPVMDPVTYAPLGYLLMKDLIVRENDAPDWTALIRPIRSVGPNDNLETTMQQLQREGANLAVVMENKAPVGIVSLEDILEEVVGRIEDEYPRLPRLFLTDALALGAVELELTAQTPDAAIRELAALIEPAQLPTGIDVGQLALDRERQMPTDIGYGIAVPHARCPGLARPIIVLGRSAEGLIFNPQGEPVRLVFLLITPADRPHFQVFFLSQIAAVAQSDFVRERLLRSASKEELLEIVRTADPAVTG